MGWLFLCASRESVFIPLGKLEARKFPLNLRASTRFSIRKKQAVQALFRAFLPLH